MTPNPGALLNPNADEFEVQSESDVDSEFHICWDQHQSHSHPEFACPLSLDGEFSFLITIIRRISLCYYEI